MPRAKRDEFLRHEKKADEETFIPYHDDEDGFVPVRQSSVVEKPKAKRVITRGKRSLEDMMASIPNDISMSVYALERIASAEDQIVKVLQLCTPGARELVLKQRKSLRRYAPED